MHILRILRRAVRAALNAPFTLENIMDAVTKLETAFDGLKQVVTDVVAKQEKFDADVRELLKSLPVNSYYADRVAKVEQGLTEIAATLAQAGQHLAAADADVVAETPAEPTAPAPAPNPTPEPAPSAAPDAAQGQ